MSRTPLRTKKITIVVNRPDRTKNSTKIWIKSQMPKHPQGVNFMTAPGDKPVAGRFVGDSPGSQSTLFTAGNQFQKSIVVQFEKLADILQPAFQKR
jgi:hypothetical protein